MLRCGYWRPRTAWENFFLLTTTYSWLSGGTIYGRNERALNSQSAAMSLHFRVFFPSGVTRSTSPSQHALPFMQNNSPRPTLGLCTSSQDRCPNRQPLKGISPAFFTESFHVVSEEPSKWSSPSEATESFISEEIWLAPPQFYEIRRLQNFASLSDLHKFCLDRAIEGPERWLPITCLTADGRLQLLPGDELYLEDSYFLENPLSTEKKTEEVMKEGKKFHRIVIHSPHVYSIHVTVQSKCKHVYPKNYVVSKSRL